MSVPADASDERKLNAASIKQAPREVAPSDGPTTRDLRILIVHAEWNPAVVSSLVQGAVSTLEAMHVPRGNIWVHAVPGSYELPWACHSILDNAETHQRIDAIIAIGTLIKGDTMHFEYIADAVSQHLMQVSIQHNKPIIFGVLTCLDAAQALVRAGLDPASPSNHNHAVDWARAAVRCASDARRFAASGPLDQKFKTVGDA